MRVIVRYAIALRHDKLQVIEGEKYEDAILNFASRSKASHDYRGNGMAR